MEFHKENMEQMEFYIENMENMEILLNSILFKKIWKFF
jgi:hypothetical protein